MPEPLDPEKFHILDEKTKKKLILGILLFLVLILPPVFYAYYKIAVFRPSQTDKEITFEINNGDSVSTVATNLAQKEVINSEFLFSLYVFLNKQDRNIQAGVYRIRAGSSLVEIVDLLQHGENDTQVTFIEGWRVEEYARAASQNFDKVDYQEFVNKAKPYEGYLFPDTYNFSKEVNEDEMISIMLANFDKKTKSLLIDENFTKTALTKEQIVILASLLEREIPKEEERPVVAGILIKRLNEDMPLGVDATTQYAISIHRLCQKISLDICAPPLEDLYKFNWWPKDLTQADIDDPSLFNTRKVIGLPPAPISNPGLSAINAIINSQTSAFLYYLNDELGNTHFAKTLEEHNENVDLYINK